MSSIGPLCMTFVKRYLKCRQY